MNESSMPPATQRWTHWGCSASATPSDRRNARQVSLWAAGWMAILLPALLVMKIYGEASLLIPSAALLASALAVLPLLRAQLRFLREADELTRAIQLQAMAVAFGAGTLAAMLEPFVAQILTRLSGSEELAEGWSSINPLIVMMLAFSLTTVTLTRRYSR